MMHGPRPPFRGGMPHHMFRSQMPARPPMGPMLPMGGRGLRGPGRAPQMRQGGGGLLARLLGRGNQIQRAAAGPAQLARAAGAGEAAGGGGILKALSNPGAISGFLGNTQKVLNTAQQFGPMVQQYGPMVKNIPAMWKLYRGLKSSSNDSEKKVDKQKEPVKTKKAKKSEPAIEQTTSKKEKTSSYGISKPKLYV